MSGPAEKSRADACDQEGGARSISLFYGAEEKKESVSRERSCVVARPVNRGGLLWQVRRLNHAGVTSRFRFPEENCSDGHLRCSCCGSARIQRLRIFACCSRAADRSRACPSAGVPSVIRTLQDKLQSQNSKIRELEERQKRPSRPWS